MLWTDSVILFDREKCPSTLRVKEAMASNGHYRFWWIQDKESISVSWDRNEESNMMINVLRRFNQTIRSRTICSEVDCQSRRGFKAKSPFRVKSLLARSGILEVRQPSDFISQGWTAYLGKPHNGNAGTNILCQPSQCDFFLNHVSPRYGNARKKFWEQRR
jgi:hypothetical protein